MNFEVKKRFRGVVLWASPQFTLAARGTKIFGSRNEGEDWECIGHLRVGLRMQLISLHPWLRRLFRCDVHHAVEVAPGRFVLCAYRGFHEVSFGEQPAKRLPEAWHGKRPLSLCRHRGCLYYGEYRNNVERSAVAVWRSRDDGRTWDRAWEFNHVRHIHGVYVDPYDDALWVTTGDLDHECGLWKTTDEFTTMERVAGGGQSTRVVQPLFCRDSLLFGSDAPREANHIYRMDRKTAEITPLVQVDGPVFFGIKVNNAWYFSTVVEPGLINAAVNATVWCSTDQGESWQRIKAFRKDFLSMRCFQYGQVSFPSSQSSGTQLWITPFATHGHQVSLCYDTTKSLRSSGP